MTGNEPHGAFAGRVVAVPETRQLDVLAALLEARGATVLRCPLVAIADSPHEETVLAWLRRLVARPPALLVFYTGEGIERLLGFASRAGLEGAVLEALRTTRKLCRGPKPRRALRRLGIDAEVDALAPTTAGVIATLDTLAIDGERVGVQLYGDKTIPELAEYLARRNVNVDWVAPYVYASAADDARVLELIAALARGGVDAITFTSQAQVDRLLGLAREHGVEARLSEGLGKTFIAAVGPVVADALRAAGFAVDAMPEDSFFMKPLVTRLATALNAG